MHAQIQHHTCSYVSLPLYNGVAFCAGALQKIVFQMEGEANLNFLAGDCWWKSHVILYFRKLLFDIVLTCHWMYHFGWYLWGKRAEKGRKKKRQNMEKSVQNLVMFYHEESLQIPEEEMAFEQ